MSNAAYTNDNGDIVGLDDLDLATALLDQGDETTAILRRAVDRAEAITVAIDVAQSEGASVDLPFVDTPAYLETLMESEDEDIRAVGAMLQEAVGPMGVTHETAADFIGRIDRLIQQRDNAEACLLEIDEFAAAVTSELVRHRRLKEPLALYEVSSERAMTADEERRLVSALREFTVNPDDRIGRLGTDHFGVLVPWIDPVRASGLLKTFSALVTEAVPQIELGVGVSAETPPPGRSTFPSATLAPATSARSMSRSR
jgi:hypothetical protein